MILTAFGQTAKCHLFNDLVTCPTPTPTPKFEASPLEDLKKLETPIKTATPASKTTIKTESPPSEEWAYIGWVNFLGDKISIYYRDLRVRRNRAEAWLRFTPWHPSRWAKKDRSLKGLSYFLQYATADCENRRLTRESTTFYGAKGRVLPVRFAAFANSFYQPLVPGSIDESIFLTLCD